MRLFHTISPRIWVNKGEKKGRKPHMEPGPSPVRLMAQALSPNCELPVLGLVAVARVLVLV